MKFRDLKRVEVSKDNVTGLAFLLGFVFVFFMSLTVDSFFSFVFGMIGLHCLRRVVEIREENRKALSL